MQQKKSEWWVDLCERIVVGVYYLAIFLSKGLVILAKKFSSNTTKYCLTVSAYALIVMWIVSGNYHLQFLHWIWPSMFSGKLLARMFEFRILTQKAILFLGGLGVAAILLAAKEELRKKRIKQSFEAIGLTNGFGKTPTVLGIYQDSYKEIVRLGANSIGLNTFESKRPALESIFQKHIASISTGRDPSVIEISFNLKELSTGLEFWELEKREPLKEESFFVGESAQGPIQKSIQSLPHLLIAGTTGGGKSVFFKQTLLGLLKSSKHIQLYLIDLKGGLEFSDFKKAPNVRVIKDIDEAVTVLESIEKEMKSRFSYLEKANGKELVPIRDRKDRIIIAIDEASVLYAKSSSKDNDLVDRAREVTDSIAKLGRAASIHLILATQKVMKESVDTVIQENISARMCFQMNTLHGSLSVLGNKDAMDLPATAGRGIWLHGNQRVEVQAPFVGGNEIQDQCEYLRQSFEANERKLFQPMLGQTQDAVNLLRKQLVFEKDVQ